MIVGVLLFASLCFGYVKRSLVMDSIKDDARQLASFTQAPDYTQMTHVREFVEHNELGGRMEFRHELELSGECRSIDHVTTIDSLRCDPRDGAMSFRFVNGAAPPAGWHVGGVLLGSAAWKCATKTATDDTRRVRFIEGEFEPFVRRIVGIEHDDVSDEWHFHTVAEVGTACLLEATVNMKSYKPEHMTVVEYMSKLEEHMEMLDRKRQAGNSSESTSSIDFRRTFNLASVDVNYNEWKDENPTTSSLIAFPADFAGLEFRCLECWMKFAIGVDITVKGQRVEPNSEWKWNLIRAKVFGKLAMALHLSLEINILHRFRPELFIRASILRMLDYSGEYFTNPHARIPVLAYLGITLVQVYAKIDLTALVRIGVSAQFRVSTGFRVTNASFEFGAESIDGGSPQLIRSANLDGSLIPLDFVLTNGSNGYALLAFGPHVMFWPWVTGQGQVQRVLNFLSWTRFSKRLEIPFPVINVHPALHIGTRFRYDPQETCIVSAPEMGMSVWLWQDMARTAGEAGEFDFKPRGITFGFSLNYVGEFPLFKIPLAEPSCLFKVPMFLQSFLEGGVCDDIENKCTERCGARPGSPARVVCKCSGGSAVMQCADEAEPYIVHPEGGLGGVVGQGATTMNGTAGMTAAPKVNVPELILECQKATTCDECAAKRSCGWCAGAARCVPGDVDSRPAECFEGDWLYDTCFRDPELQFTTIGDNENWVAGETKTIKWTSRNDVPIASVAITYRWSPNTPWLLADHIANTGAYVFKVPDGVPPTSSFQLMVQALPLVNGQTPAITQKMINENGRAYAMSKLISLTAPNACSGPNGESGSCISEASCAAINGILIYKGRRNEREGCTTIADTSVKCCTSVKLRRRGELATGAARIAVGPYGACPPCGTGTITARRSAYCLDGSATPVDIGDAIAKGQDATCGKDPMPVLETSCGALPACTATPITIIQPRDAYTVETNVAVAGKPYEISWQGGQLDLPADVQVLIGSGCTTGGAMDADKWQSIAKLPAFAGLNKVTWNVPMDLARNGSPQWARVRVVLGTGQIVGVAAGALMIAHPATVEVRFNGAAATNANPIASAGAAPVIDDTSTAQSTDQVIGSARLQGASSQALVRFAAKSATFASFDVGKVRAVQLTFSDDEARQMMTQLEIITGDGTSLKFQAPLASALYTCSDSGDCVLDLQSKIVEDAVPAEQTCLFGAKYAPPSADMSMTDQPLAPMGSVDTVFTVPVIVGIAVGAAALCALIVLGLVCIVRRRSGSSSDAYVEPNPTFLSARSAR